LGGFNIAEGMEKKPFVINANKAVKDIVKAIIDKKDNAIAPGLPLLSY